MVAGRKGALMNPSDAATLEDVPPEGPRLLLLDALVDELVADADAAHAAFVSGKPRGPVIGLGRVDEELGSYLAPGLHLVQAAPGAGKTAFGLQVASDCGCPALFVTAEMPPLELFRRLIARATGTYLGRLKRGELPPAHVAALARQTAARLPHLALLDATRAFADPDLLRSSAAMLRERMEAKHFLMVIDSLQVWARGAARSEATEYDRVTLAVEAASRMAAALTCPILAPIHRNRAGQKEGGMHAGKGSGDLEYGAESLLELTPQKGAASGGEVKDVTLTICKNRHGRSDVEIPLRFEGRLQTFQEA
jgi:replicative DNA helicase